MRLWNFSRYALSSWWLWHCWLGAGGRSPRSAHRNRRMADYLSEANRLIDCISADPHISAYRSDVGPIRIRDLD